LVNRHAFLAGAIEISEPLQRQPARPLGRLAFVDELADPHLDVKGELRLDVGFGSRPNILRNRVQRAID
jgi:hypothetical protein